MPHHSLPGPSGRAGPPRSLSSTSLSVAFQNRSLSPVVRATAGSAAPLNPGPRAGTVAAASPHTTVTHAPATPSHRWPLWVPLRGRLGEEGPGRAGGRSRVNGWRRCSPGADRVPTMAAAPSQGPSTSSEGAGVSSHPVLHPAQAGPGQSTHTPTHEAARTAKASGGRGRGDHSRASRLRNVLREVSPSGRRWTQTREHLSGCLLIVAFFAVLQTA